MKYIGFFILSLALVIPNAAADTVMVGLLNIEGGDYFSQQRALLASAVVEGAMGVFFESDHIVFDLGLPSDDEELLPDSRTAVGIARAGGAEYFLDMRVGSPEEETGIPSFITFAFIDLISDHVLANGTIKKADVYSEQADSIGICALFGSTAAAEAIHLLK